MAVDQGTAGRVGVDLAGEGLVQLDDLGPHVDQALEAGEAAAGIVHGHPHAPLVDQADRLAQLVVGVELALLGDLDDDPLGRQLGQDFEQGGPVQQARGRR